MFIAVADNLLALIGNKLVRHLRQVLHSARPLHIQAHPNHHEVGKQQQEDQQLHRKRIRNRRLRKGRLHMERSQQPVHRTGKVSVQKSCK